MARLRGLRSGGCGGARVRGFVSVFAVLLLFGGLLFFLLQTLRQSAWGAIDSLRQLDSEAALLLAESGLEHSRLLLQGADLSQASACQSLAGVPPYSLGAGRVALAGFPNRKGSACLDDCDTCTVSATGQVRGIERELRLALPQAGRSSPAGCGGQGVLPVSCPVAGIAPADWHAVVEHVLPQPLSPALLLTNLGFVRYPGSSPDDVYPGASCAALGSDASVRPCESQWFIESSNKKNPAVVASRGATVALDGLDYQLKQQLSLNSLFAASAATFRGLTGRPVWVGSYWGVGVTTGANASTTQGWTNYGVACLPDAPVGKDCPAPTPVNLADPLTGQSSRSWCSGADTLVIGFTGSSASGGSGRLLSLRFGPDHVASVEIAQAPVEFPLTDPAQGRSSRLYSTLRYLYNPDFLTATDVLSGAVLNASMGSVAQARLSKDSGSMAVNAVAGAALAAGDLLDNPDLVSGTTLLFCSGSRLIDGVNLPCGVGGSGAYDLSQPARRSDASAQVRVLSHTLWVTSASRPYLEAGDTLSGTGVARGSVVDVCSGSRWVGGVAVPCGTGGLGAYAVSGNAQAFAPTEILTNGRSISTASGLPQAGTRLAFLSGSGTGRANLGASSFIASAPVASGAGAYKLFDLAQRPATRVSGAQLCGGMCALFDHESGGGSFEIEITGTTQWAAGLSCLRGVDPAGIVGVGAAQAIPAPIWHERLH